MAFDDKVENTFLRLLWKLLLGLVTLMGQIVFRNNGESCAIVAEERNLTRIRIDKRRILE